MDLSPSQWYILQFHQEANSPYLYVFAHDQGLWIKNNTLLYIELGKQIDTININKSNYTCYEDNSNNFMHCMESYYSRKLGCVLPWVSQDIMRNDSLNLCKGKEKFEEFRNISMNILKSESNRELMNEGCFMHNCEQKSWEIKNSKDMERRKNDKLITGFQYHLPRHTKVLVRKEVKLYTLINFFAEVGGYLGLLLGESLLSYLITVSKWWQILGRKLKECCRKADKDSKVSPL